MEPDEFLSAVLEAEDNNDDELIENLLCGAVKHLKNNRAKPESAIYLGLMYLAKTRPSFLHSDVVVEVSSRVIKHLQLFDKRALSIAYKVLLCL